MTDTTSKPAVMKSSDKTEHVLDLNGAEQHHDLKNQPGTHGDQDHATSGDPSSDEVKDIVKDAVSGADADTSVATALNDAVKS